jgi:leader peptidase (prepilin peptidase)/N-methyltransferase
MLVFCLVFVLVIGAAIGSFLNVCIYRLPLEKSLLWPESRCGNCLRPIRWYDNIPLVSYWLLRGRCRDCKTPFSVRYFFVELGTALAFAGLFYLEVRRNVLAIPFIDKHQADFDQGNLAAVWPMGVLFAYHATLLSFLIVASLVDIDHMEIPLPITITGMVFGVVGSLFVAWPFPNDAPVPLAAVPQNGDLANVLFPPGIFAWPVWHPSQLPPWLPQGSWQLGLATSVAGVVAGMVVLRAVRFLFGVARGVEGLGIGDADLMMMAGSFIGWQPVLLAFFVSVIPGLFFGLLHLFLRGNQALPFGPSLALGVVITLLGWQVIGEHFRPVFFIPAVLGFMAVAGAVLLLVMSFALRILGGKSKEGVG